MTLFHASTRVLLNSLLISMPLIDPQLKALLVCPTCHSDLEEDESKGVLRCTQDGTEFPVRDGIPIMMVDAPAPETSETA